MKHKVRILLAFFAAIILGSVAYAQNSAAGVGVIVIDAGHGGKDAGAIGRISQEKNINLAVAKELGGEIVTVGSDAHTADRVGQHIDKALEMAKEIFGYVCTFSDRKPIFHRL